MKKILVALTLILIAMTVASPVLAAGVHQETTAPVDMKEPLIVTQLTDPVVPNPLWPGDTISWTFQIENISPHDYWAQAYIGVTIASGGIQYNQEIAIGQKGGTIHLPAYQAFMVPKLSSLVVTVNWTIDESSEIAQGVQFSPTVTRVRVSATKGM